MSAAYNFIQTYRFFLIIFAWVMITFLQTTWGIEGYLTNKIPMLHTKTI